MLVFVLFAGTPTVAAIRATAPSSVEVAGAFGRSFQGGGSVTTKPRATKAVPGAVHRHVTSGPRQLFLKKAHTAVFDVRGLKGRVVKRERPEHRAPGEPAVEAEAPVTALPSTVSPKTIAQAAAPAPAPDKNFAGLDFANWGDGHPPDTNGDVGPAYYIQTINTSVGIYDKSNGNRVAAFTFDAFMSQGHFGNLCDTDNFGDPVVVYDSFEDRWIVTDFAFKLDASGNVNPPHAFQCFAVSKTSDPIAGGWNFYSIETPGGLGDYPKFGVWPDGLYMSVNMFGYSASSSYISPHVWALNKAQMYAGAPTVQVADFAASSDDFSLLPANARLQTGTPPAGSSEYFASTEEFLNGLTIYKFHVDWDKISTSTFTGPTTQVAPTCWPNAEPANASTPANAADTLAIRAMAQAQYTNLSGAESLWISHTVNRGEFPTASCGSANTNNATVRWYQANVTGGTVAANVVQGATFDPEGANTFFRFMPSLAIDRAGDMAIGYTKSNATTNPQLKYAGRLASDPTNTLGQGEQTLIDGTGAQSGNCGGSACTRWGDYSGMALDPNGCEFWETGEYYATNGLNHQTRIGSFNYPGCTTVGNGTVSGQVTYATNPLAGVTVALGSRTTTTDGNGNYSFSVPAGTYPSLTASKSGFTTGSASSVAVPNGSAAIRNFTLGAAAQSGCFTDNSQSTFQRGAPANCDLNASPGNVVLASPDNTAAQNGDVTPSGFSFNSTSWAGQTFTPTVSGQLKRVDVELFCSGCSGTNPDITVSLRNTSGGVPTGSDLATATLAGFNDGSAGGLKTVVFGSPATVTAGTKYAFVFRSVSNRTAGVYAYTCSCVTSGYSDSNPYTSGQRVTSTNSGTTWAADSTVGGRDLSFVTYINPGFASSGTFVSSLKDANPAAGRTPNWTTMSWTAATPTGTAVKFQVAGSNSEYGPFNFVGPDGTAATFFTTSGASLSQFNGFRYLKYEAFLSTTNGSVTPSVSSVQVCFADTVPTSPTSLAVAPATGTYGGSTTLTATLTAGGSPVAGETVAFTLNGASEGTATTDASGVATLNSVSLAGIGAGAYPTGVGASFAGDTGLDPSNGASSLTVAKADQAIAITSVIPSAVYNSTFTIEATGGGSANPIVFGSSGACSNSGPTYTITSGTGVCTVSLDQAGDANYNAAPERTASLVASQAPQKVTVETPAPASAGYRTTFEVAATAGTGMSVIYSSAGACTNSGRTFTITRSSGTCTVMYDQPGDSNYKPAVQVSESVGATKATQSITVTSRSTASAVYGSSFTVAATGGGSTSPVTFSSGGSCSNVGPTFKMTSGTGTCTVEYDQAGNDDFTAAPPVTENVTAQKAHLAVAPSPAAATRQYSDPNPAIAAAVSGFVNGETAAVLTSHPTCGSAAAPSSAPGTYGIGCSGGSAANYVFSYSGGALSVVQEDARAAYSGSATFKTASAAKSTAAATLSATIRDISAVGGDPFPGDIRNATVTFVNRATGIAFAGCSNLPVTLPVPSDATTGAGGCSTAIAAPKAGKMTYTVGIVVGGFYARNSTSEDQAITVTRAARKKQPKKIMLCYRRHTVHVTAAKAKTLRKHGANLGACKKTKKK